MHFSKIGLVLLAVSIGGCSTVDLKQPRADDFSAKNREHVKQIAELRAKSVAENETYFTDQLRCIGKAKTLADLAMRVSVGPIYDKTGKVFPQGSTAISDMVLNSLSHVHAIRIVETPLSGEITESRVNLLSRNYVYLAKVLKDNIAVAANKISHLPFGVLFPSQLHITGALVQYDEGTETLTPGFRLDLDILTVDRQVETISVGLHLRLINSGDGEILTNYTKDKRGSVLLSNKFYKIKLDSSLFKLISSKPYGIDYSITVADPKQYVIQELVEKGVVELMSVLPSDGSCGY